MYIFYTKVRYLFIVSDYLMVTIQISLRIEVGAEACD